MWREKISALVDFPLEGLDLRNYISGPVQQGRCSYSLYAVSVSFQYYNKHFW